METKKRGTEIYPHRVIRVCLDFYPDSYGQSLTRYAVSWNEAHTEYAASTRPGLCE